MRRARLERDVIVELGKRDSLAMVDEQALRASTAPHLLTRRMQPAFRGAPAARASRIMAR
jgi:hypothetical protein